MSAHQRPGRCCHNRAGGHCLCAKLPHLDDAQACGKSRGKRQYHPALHCGEYRIHVVRLPRNLHCRTARLNHLDLRGFRLLTVLLADFLVLPADPAGRLVAAFLSEGLTARLPMDFFLPLGFGLLGAGGCALIRLPSDSNILFMGVLSRQGPTTVAGVSQHCNRSESFTKALPRLPSFPNLMVWLEEKVLMLACVSGLEGGSCM